MASRIIGMDSFKEAMNAKVNKVSDGMDKIIQSEGKAVLSRAKDNVPVITGDLKNSIQYTYSDHIATVSTDVDYAPYVEYGTFTMAAEPYMRPAYQGSQDRIEKETKRLLK